MLYPQDDICREISQRRSSRGIDGTSFIAAMLPKAKLLILVLDFKYLFKINLPAMMLWYPFSMFVHGITPRAYS